MTPQEIEAQAGAIEAALAAQGITPESALHEEGRRKTWPRFYEAYERAAKYGYEELASRIENMVETEAAGHARRGLRRGQPSAPPPPETLGGRSAPLAPPLPVSGTFDPMPLRGSVFGPSVARNVSDAPPEGGQPAPMMPPTLTGQENAPPPPMPAPTLAGQGSAPPPPTEQPFGGDPFTGQDVGRALRRDQVTQTFGVDPDAPDFQRQVGVNFLRQAVPQVAFGMLPAAGGILGRFAAAQPRAAAALGAATAGAVGGNLLAPWMGQAEAQQGRRKQPAQPAGPPPDDGLQPEQRARREELNRLQQEDGRLPRALRTELEGINKISSDYATAKNAARTDAERIAATEKAKLASEEARRTTAEENRRQRAATPTRELFADYMSYVPAATGLASLLLGAATRGRSQANFNREIADTSQRWGSAVGKAQNARAGSPAQQRHVTEARGLGDEYRALAAPERGARRLLAGGHGTPEAMGAGAGVGLIGAFLPEEIDFARAAAGSPLWESLNKTIIQDWPSTAKRAAIAMGLGAAASRVGTEAISPFMSRPMPRGYGPATAALPPSRPQGGTAPPPPLPLAAPPATSPAPPPPIPSARASAPTLSGSQPTSGAGQSSSSRVRSTDDWPEVPGYRIVGTGATRRYQDERTNLYVSREDVLPPHQSSRRLTRGQ